MKNQVNLKLFSILLVTCILTSLIALPYTLSLLGDKAPVFTPILLLGVITQALIMFSVAIYVGLYLAKKVGFGLPIIEGALRGEKQGENIKSILMSSIAWGVLAAVLIIIFSLPFQSMSLDFLKADVAIATWKAFLVSFYGGVAEEVLLRLFLMTLFVWLAFKIKKTIDGKVTATGVWLAIILSSIIFGLGHLPVTSGVTEITPLVVLRALLLNGVGGIIFGWLYWKKGLESAIISHFSADIVLHVITPIVASFLIK